MIYSNSADPIEFHSDFDSVLWRIHGWNFQNCHELLRLSVAPTVTVLRERMPGYFEDFYIAFSDYFALKKL